MSKWQDTTTPLTLKGGISMPYTWSVGETGSRFLTALRDEHVITANKCRQCGIVYVPPRSTCPQCFQPLDKDNLLELSGRGRVAAFTIVHYESPIHPVKAPFAIALIDLEGADARFTHIIKDGLEKLSNGSAVRPVFRQDCEGCILDIDCFELSDKE